MRIIHAAKQPEEIEMICPTCHSILGISQSDIDHYGKMWRFYCPICHNYAEIGDPKILFPWIMEDKNEKLQSDNTVREYSI